jgi:tRNA-specific 2-thiouridylase
MFEEYKHGRTPNPDVLCNREIKFDAFLKKALELGADFVATGHYCRKESFTDNEGKEIFRILAGSDPNKDQSYFLCQLTQEQLSKSMFPIGHLLKPDVRKLAAEAGLPSAEKKDSQGICFVGKIDLPVFLQQKLEAKDGDVVEVFNDFYENNPLIQYQKDGYEMVTEDNLSILSQPFEYTKKSGKVIGTHTGAHFYTIGQRKGLNIGGHVEPLFIISTDVDTNTIYVGEGQDHPGLFRKALFIKEEEIHWIRTDLKMNPGEMREYLVRIRYRQPLQKGRLYKVENGVYMVFDQPQRGITPGQFAAWYCGDEMLGSGVIK